MDSGRIRFFLSEVRRNFTRNLVMQFTAIGTVAVTIVLLGSFLVTRQTLSAIGADVVHKIEISVFLTDRATPAQAKALANRISHDPRVSGVTYVSRGDGLKAMRDRFRGQIDTSLLTTNPLPEALHVRVKDPNRVTAVATGIRTMPNVANVEFAQDAVQKLLALSVVLGRIGIAIVALLVFTAAIIISNTIRLTVFARRREIAIMQLVGASSSYILLPFIVEGLIAGVLGAAIAVVLLLVAQAQLLPKLVGALTFLPLRLAHVDTLTFVLELIGTGAAVGIVAAWLSVGRYLRA